VTKVRQIIIFLEKIVDGFLIYENLVSEEEQKEAEIPILPMTSERSYHEENIGDREVDEGFDTPSKPMAKSTKV
jgi:hypothetical protein